MITIPVYIKGCSDKECLLRKQVDYSYAFRKLYKNIDKTKNKAFADKIQKRFNLTDIEYRSLASDVDTKFKQIKTNKENQEWRWLEIKKDVEDLESKSKTNKLTRVKFKKSNKLREIEDLLSRDITFGGKQTLRELVKLHNNTNVINRISDKKERDSQLSENDLKIKEKTEQFREGRILHFYILGEANQKGNRFFDFNFADNKIVYKPKRGKKVEIAYTCSKKYQKQLLKLQRLIENKEIAITLTVSAKQVCMSFDDEALSGYCIDKKERTKEVNTIKKTVADKEKQKEIISAVYKKYYENLKQKKLEGKMSDRYMGVDINPYYIGYCIANKGADGIKRIVKKGCFDFSKLDDNLHLASDNPIKISQNNKRRFEIQNAWKRLFETANQYRVAHFVKEDVSEIGKNEAFECKEANRKIKNIWHREIADWQIEKRCIMLGIELITIIPVYTSFIGNMTYDYFDATNAAIEICRRGMFKYKKGLFYPQITGTITDTMSKMLESQKIQVNPRDAQIIKDCRKWDMLYKIATNNGLRWRWDWDKAKKPSSIFSMSNAKSKVQIVQYANCS